MLGWIQAAMQQNTISNNFEDHIVITANTKSRIGQTMIGVTKVHFANVSNYYLSNAMYGWHWFSNNFAPEISQYKLVM